MDFYTKYLLINYYYFIQVIFRSVLEAMRLMLVRCLKIKRAEDRVITTANTHPEAKVFPYITKAPKPGMQVSQALMAASADPTIDASEIYFLILRVVKNPKTETKPTNQEPKMAVEKVTLAALPPLNWANTG